MKRHILSTLLLLATYSSAQEVTIAVHRVKVSPNARIELNLEGNIMLEHWDSPALEIQVKTVSSGTVLGLSNHDERSPYDITVEGTESALVVNPARRESAWVVGVTTLKEKYLHSVHIPRNVDVIVKTVKGKVMVNGSFTRLQIRNEHGQTQLNFNPALIKFLSCETFDGQIILDDQIQEEHYTLLGKGNLVYQIISKDGSIVLSTGK